MITKIYPDNPDRVLLDALVAQLRDGALVIYPTGISYAYGCSAYKARAIEEVCRLKGVDPRRHRLAIMCADIADFTHYAKVDNQAFRFIREHKKEPITYLLPATSGLSKLLINKHEVGLRLPLHPLASLLIEALGEPLLTASLPLKEEDPEYRTTPELIDEVYGHEVFTILDGGCTMGGTTAMVSLIGGTIKEIRPAHIPNASHPFDL